MPPLTNLLAFAATAFVIIVIPGPSVLFVVGRSLSLGRRGGVLSAVGNAAGMVPPLLAVSLGVGALLAQSVVIFQTVKLAGAGYLVYLGVQAIRHRRVVQPELSLSSHESRGRLIRQGFLVGVTNPKSIVFFVAVLPQFAEPAAGSLPLQLAVLGAIQIAIGLITDCLWALTASTARGWFARSPRRMSNLGLTGGVMLIGLGATVAVTGNKS
ncbi:MAG: LysE family translocator [Propionibacteriaceae bacterium]